MKRHRWTKVSKVSAGRYEATPAAFMRETLYPAKCDDCGALISVGRRPAKRGGDRTVEVETFSTDSGATWDEERPPCYDRRADEARRLAACFVSPASAQRAFLRTKDRALHSETARERRRS